jgi:NADH:ubiquinone oxidoreductase subunit 5 (subunit L)/multisubunit Na+/H+ antiporter MnhA subunit
MFIKEPQERLISSITTYTIGTVFFTLTGFIGYWAFLGANNLNIKEILLYQSKEYTFLIDFYFDRVTAVYLFVGSFISFLIVRYSSYYMHLEKGYKRFFATILFFFFSYNFTVLAGNFETLFIGWEMIGISSFLLIAFYRERYLPVRNAVKVFSVYRIGDIGILLAMWASHHLWHENITFQKLLNYDLVHEHLVEHSFEGLFIAVCLLVAAAAKSAQFPFSSWMPRAMEGPTPSSAIFYGSYLSILAFFY